MKKYLKESRNVKTKYLIFTGLIISLFIIIITVSASWMLLNYTKDLLIDNLRERLLSISITQASNISADDLNALRVESDWQKPEWNKVVSQLKNTKEDNDDIVFMYIFRKRIDNPNMMEFVADAGSLNPYANLDDDESNDVDANNDGIIDPEGADYLQWPGQPYDEAIDIPEAYQAYNGPLTAEELYEDSFGEVLTGYAPIKNDRDEVVAILATDIKAGDFVKLTRQISTPFGIFIVFLIGTILILALVLIYMMRRESNAKIKIEDLAKNLQTANGRLKELDQQKSEFVSLASHQLRGPLTAIKGYVSLLLEGDYGEISKDVKGALEKVEISTRGLALLVGDYLDVSRIELGRMKYSISTFSLNDLLSETIQETTPTIDKAGLKLNIDIDRLPANVSADKNKIKQVLLNIIDNSIKYTPEGSLFISLKRNDGYVVVSVKDTGVGISSSVIPTLFEKFSRAPNASKTNIIGTGLGLYVAEKILTQSGGTIWAESEGEGKGSTFSIRLNLV